MSSQGIQFQQGGSGDYPSEEELKILLEAHKKGKKAFAEALRAIWAKKRGDTNGRIQQSNS